MFSSKISPSDIANMMANNGGAAANIILNASATLPAQQTIGELTNDQTNKNNADSMTPE